MATAALARGATVGRYVVLDRLGAGGMGVVYAAYDPDLNRRVALKLVMPRRGGSAAEQARLLREAQALARLSHPNVVTIYDVGSVDDRVFLAMELVEGQTLHDVLRAKQHAWRDVLAMFRAAGEGLAVAHAADLVHRDFKPGNVLVGNDGRVRVMDFGLARAVETTAGEPEPDDELGSSPSRDAFGEPLTHAGMLMGTPVYMPPEVLRGERGDAAGDQFSFAVALYEGLYRRLPFDAKLPPTDAKRWQPIEPPRTSDVPRWVREIVFRGLARDPGERYPSMRVLVDALGHDPAVRRRRWMVIVAAACAVGGVGFGFTQLAGHAAPAPCSGSRARLDGIWPRAKSATVAPETWSSVAPILDAYASRWAKTHEETCRATRVHGDQSEDVMTLRMACLDRRRTDLETIVELLADPDKLDAANAVDAAHRLPPLDRCSDVEALRAPVPPPEDADVRRRVDDVYRELSRARITKDRPALTAIAARAQTIGWAPLVAEAENELAYSQFLMFEREASEASYQRAATAALAGNDDRALAQAFIGRVQLLAAVNRFDEARRELPLIAALLPRVHDAQLQARALFAEARMEALANHPDKSLQLAEGGRAAVAKRHGADSVEMGDAHFESSIIMIFLGRIAEAEHHAQRSLEIRRQRLGIHHPSVLEPLDLITLTLTNAGKLDEVAKIQEEVEATVREVYGDNHEQMAPILEHKAYAHMTARRFDEALALREQAAAIYARALPGSIMYGDARARIGETLIAKGEHARGLELLEEGYAINLAKGQDVGPLHSMLDHIAGAQTKLGRERDALATLDKAFELLDKTSGIDRDQGRVTALGMRGKWHLDHGDKTKAVADLEASREALAKVPHEASQEAAVDSNLGVAYAEVGRWRDALPLLDKAWTYVAKQPETHAMRRWRSYVRFAQARAIDGTGGRARGIELARSALADCTADDLHDRKLTIERWLAARGVR